MDRQEMEQEGPEHRFQRDLASYSHEQDLYKHLATLSAGSIVLLVGFWDKTAHLARSTLAVALVLFGVSILGALAMQLMSVLEVDTGWFNQGWRSHKVIGALSIFAGFGGFLGGMAALIVFALRNL